MEKSHVSVEMTKYIKVKLGRKKISCQSRHVISVNLKLAMITQAREPNVKGFISITAMFGTDYSTNLCYKSKQLITCGTKSNFVIYKGLFL